MTSPTFTLVHVVLSVLGIISGLVLAGGLVSGRRLDGWAAAFLATTILTNVTGFGFPSDRVLPSHIVGGISLVILALTTYALYGKGAAGGWRTVFTLGSVAALYFNVFVLVVQLFFKVPAMAELAPTQAEPPFAVTQLLVLAVFAALGRAATRGYRGA